MSHGRPLYSPPVEYRKDPDTGMIYKKRAETPSDVLAINVLAHQSMIAWHAWQTWPHADQDEVKKFEEALPPRGPLPKPGFGLHMRKGRR